MQSSAVPICYSQIDKGPIYTNKDSSKWITFDHSRENDNDYSMFHVTWTTFKFNRNQLGTFSAFVMMSVP